MSIPKMDQLKKYIQEMLLGMNIDDIEQVTLVITEDNAPTEKYSVRITNFNSKVNDNTFWHQARGIFMKLYAIDAAIGEAKELTDEQYRQGKRTFYIIAMTDGRYPCSELDDWIPAEPTDLVFQKTATSLPIRTIENEEFKLETFAMIAKED